MLFESPRRLSRTLQDLLRSGGDRRVAVVRELTKLHQEVVRGTLSLVVDRFHDREPRGEVVVVVEGASPPRDPDEAVRLARDLVAQGDPKRTAARLAAHRTGVAAAHIYDALVADDRGEEGSSGAGRLPDSVI